MNISGLILSGIYSDGLDVLTSHRTVASLPFGGRYRQIDFIMSNMVNSDINDIGVITKYNYQSLLDHLGTFQAWDLNRKRGGLKLIPPFVSSETGSYRGKIEELRAALPYLKSLHSDFVILADTNTICNINLKTVVELHLESGRDVTIVSTQIKQDDLTPSELVFNVSPSGEVQNIFLNYCATAGQYLSDGIYVFNRRFLIAQVEKYAAMGFYHLERDLLQQGFNTKTLSVGIYPFVGKVLKNRTIPEYFRNALSLTDPAVRDVLFNPARPIYTTVRDEVPTYYGPESRVSACVIADGCSIKGTAKNSVISRGVTIEKGATVCNSIIMDGCMVRSGAIIENAILDKNVEVLGSAEICGSPSSPAIVGKGTKAV